MSKALPGETVDMDVWMNCAWNKTMRGLFERNLLSLLSLSGVVGVGRGADCLKVYIREGTDVIVIPKEIECVRVEVIPIPYD